MEVEPPNAFGDQVDHSNAETTRLVKVKCTSEELSWYSSDILWAKIKPPSRGQYKPDDFLEVKPLNFNAKMDEDDDDENWADPQVPTGRRSHPSDSNGNDDSEVLEVMHHGLKGIGKGKSTKYGKGKWKGKVEGNGKGKGSV